MKNILFVADPLHTFKIYKDSTYVMMKELSARGVNVWACEPKDIFSPASSSVSARMQSVRLLQVAHVSKAGEASEWYKTEPAQVRALKEMDAIVLRQDPPFNSEYFYLTHLLQVAQRQGAKVFNDPAAVRDHPEKLSILEFPELTPPTLVSRDALKIREFHAHYKDIILKPLDGMGGMGIFRIKEDGLNLGVARELTKAEIEISNYLGPILSQRGLFLVGLDVIGDYLTEINVTSPTCFQEITQQKGYDVAKTFVDALFKHL